MRRNLLHLFFSCAFLLSNAIASEKEIFNCHEISPDCSNTPTPVFSPDGTLWIAFEQHGHIYVSSSNDLGQTFTPATQVNKIAEEIYTNGENRPKILLDSEQRIFISWTKKTAGRFSGDIRFSRSIDNGENYSTPITVNTDKQLIGHRFDALAINQQDEIFIVWFDKRDQTKAKKNGNTYRGTALYYAVSTDHGASFADNQKIADHSCECCRIAVAFNQHNDLHILWRHIFNRNTRDHALLKITPTREVTSLTRITYDDWHIDACPHHGPDLSIDDNEQLHFAWYTQGVNQQGIFYGRLNNITENKSIKKNMDSTTGASHPQVLSHQGVIYYVWKRFNGEQTELVLKISLDDGESWSQNQIITQTENTSDHPLLVDHQNNVYVSWLRKNEGYHLLSITN